MLERNLNMKKDIQLKMKKLIKILMKHLTSDIYRNDNAVCKNIIIRV